MTHSGVGEPYPVKGPGPVTFDHGVMRWVDGASGEVMEFVFAGRYKHDPDPRYRYHGDGSYGLESATTTPATPGR